MSNTVILPVDKSPAIQTYGDHANQMSVLSFHPNFKEWYYSNYMFISYWCCPPHEHPAFFDYDLLSRCKLVDTYCFHAIGSRQLADTATYIKENISNGIYCVVPLNERFVPGTAAYHKYDFYHRNFFYGFSDEKREFYVMTHKANRRYQESIISYDEFEDSIIKVSSFTWPIITIKNNSNTYKVDWGKIADDFKKYICPYRYLKEGIECVSGIDVSLAIIDDMKKTTVESKWCDPRVFQTIKEHKKILLDKINYFYEVGVISTESDLLYQFTKIYECASILEMLFLKYEITHKETIISKMIAKLNEIYIIESDVIPQITHYLEQYLKEIHWEHEIGFNDIQKTVRCGSAEENSLLVDYNDELCSVGILEKPHWSEKQRNIMGDGYVIYELPIPINAKRFSIYVRAWGSVNISIVDDSDDVRLVYTDNLEGPADNIKILDDERSGYGEFVKIKFTTNNCMAMTDFTWCYSF